LRPRQQEPVHGKESVGGSSPSEGSAKAPEISAFNSTLNDAHELAGSDPPVAVPLRFAEERVVLDRRRHQRPAGLHLAGPGADVGERAEVAELLAVNDRARRLHDIAGDVDRHHVDEAAAVALAAP
jgi:hypothetical protein